MSAPFVFGVRYCETAGRYISIARRCPGFHSNLEPYLAPPSHPNDQRFREGAIIDLSRTLKLGFERRKAWVLRVIDAHVEQTGIHLFITDDDILNGRECMGGFVSSEGEDALYEVYESYCDSCKDVACQDPAMCQAVFKRWAIYQLDTTDWATLAKHIPWGTAWP
ncbi:hypothetical protein CPLU01_12573 [Colletotrichum plurivorum]|uniref:Uncharacterized protein n=1 Tax=Colletotrichum plurivorum TaxID=2175906 RepID=A0A8H6N6D8_9PEZI|nr:hypothetical protein CPLU01_12573 [Colletotrichum plurivorum]